MVSSHDLADGIIHLKDGKESWNPEIDRLGRGGGGGGGIGCS